jgi:membrane-bound serine protease (ClpP class)
MSGRGSVSALGVLLLVVGASLVVAEAHVPTHGALGAPGVAALTAAVAILVLGTGGGTALAVALAVAMGLAGAATVGVVAVKGLAARRGPVRSGTATLEGRLGEIRRAPEPVGQVFVDGALWRARRSVLAEDERLQPGDPVVVERVNGLTLIVRSPEEWETVA